MPSVIRSTTLFILIVGCVLTINSRVAAAQEPGWYPYTFARGADRETIKQTPIQLRPYRPFHFYGNSIRRDYYRGNPLPTIRDARMTARNLIFRR